MDWRSSNGRIDSFRFMRVNRDSWLEVERLDGIAGGVLERNALTDIKASGSLDYVAEPVLGRDLLRVWSDSVDVATGERASIAHGTYLVSTPSSSYRGSIEEGSVDLYGVLQILMEDSFEEPLALPSGTLAVAKAVEMVRDVGLPVVAAPSSAALNADAVFDEDASKLDVVNWLLDFAGFESADCDGFGNVLMRPYRVLANRVPALSLKDDDSCVYRSGVVRECDGFGVPNVVVVSCSNASGDHELVPAIAVNDDPSSAFSTVSRGRRIVHKESVKDVFSQDVLQSKAEALLAEKTSVSESFEINHAYVPMEMGDACSFVYAAAGIRRDDLVAVRQSMTLRPGMECVTSFRCFSRG